MFSFKWKDFYISRGVPITNRFEREEEKVKKITKDLFERYFGEFECLHYKDCEIVVWSKEYVVSIVDYEGPESLRGLPRQPLNGGVEEMGPYLA